MSSHVTALHPFPGLRPFDYADREFYFGRDDQIYALYRMFEFSRFVAVVGSSGSGKSSLVRAGLLPLLDRESHGKGGRTWRSLTIKPGDTPIENLACGLAALAPDDGHKAIREDSILHALTSSSFGLAEALDEVPDMTDTSLMIVVDQFEEIFRYATAATREKAMLFVKLLLEGTRTRHHPVYVLITMRSDFIGDCSLFFGLPEAVSSAQFLVPSLTRDQRQSVITQPIEKAGGTIDPALVQRLLQREGDDSSADMDRLPVLQHAMARLWELARQRSGSDTPSIELQDYEAIGSLEHALSRHADEVMNTEELRGLGLTVQMVFRALSDRDREGRATRRSLPFAALVAETDEKPEDVARVVDRFRNEDCSFLVASVPPSEPLQNDTRIDVGHEALLRRWEKISGNSVDRGWLATEEEDGRWLRGLAALAGTS